MEGLDEVYFPLDEGGSRSSSLTGFFEGFKSSSFPLRFLSIASLKSDFLAPAIPTTKNKTKTGEKELDAKMKITGQTKDAPNQKKNENHVKMQMKTENWG